MIDLRSRALVTAGAGAIRALSSTWRFRQIADDPSVVPRARDNRVVIYAFWHAHMLPLLALHRGHRVAVLISSHRDGERIAGVAHRFGFETVRGSTTRGGASAIRGMERALADGYAVAVTPDGPRGPAGQFAPGALIAARRAGVPIVLTGVAADRAWRLRSWDRFMIPKLFARIAVVYDDATTVAADTPRDAAAAAADYQTRLLTLDGFARAAC